MPPALVAELEDVEEQLARLCDDLGVEELPGVAPDDDEVKQNNNSDMDADDEYLEDDASDVIDGQGSLVSSLAAATSECEALMELLDDDWGEENSLGDASGDEGEGGSVHGDQSDTQPEARAVSPRTQGIGQDRHRETTLNDQDSGKTRSEGRDDLVDELDSFAGELEALSSLMAGLHHVISDDDQGGFDGEDEGDGSSALDHPENAWKDQAESCCAEPTLRTGACMITTVRPAPGHTQAGERNAPRPESAIISEQRTTPNQPKHRVCCWSGSLRVRAHKRTSPRKKSLKRVLVAGNCATTEAYWNDFQRKSFARHISRQQLARVRALEEHAEEERLAAARFQHSATLTHYQQLKQGKKVKGEKKPPATKSACTDGGRSYLDRFFHCHEPKSGIATEGHDGDVIRNKDATTRVLCGVYVYGHRLDGVVYMTFASMAQLRERVASRLGVNQVVNLYRERGVSAVAATSASVQPLSAANRQWSGKKKPHLSRLLQRISSFDQIADGDVLCVTRDAYEDMAILCEWMTQRRQRPSSATPGTVATSEQATRPPTTVSRGVRCEQTLSNAVPALRRMVEGDAARMNRSKSGVPPLWDCNGRSIRIGDVAYRVESGPKESKLTTNASYREH